MLGQGNFWQPLHAMDASQDTTSEAMSKGDRAAVVREMARLTIEHFRDVWRKEQKKRDDAKLKAGKWYCVNSDDFGAENCLHAALEVDRVWLKNNWGTIIKSINVLIPLDHGVSVVTHGRFERKLWGGGTLTTQYRFVWFSERFFRADLSAADPGAIDPPRRAIDTRPSSSSTYPYLAASWTAWLRTQRRYRASGSACSLDALLAMASSKLHTHNKAGVL